MPRQAACPVANQWIVTRLHWRPVPFKGLASQLNNLCSTTTTTTTTTTTGEEEKKKYSFVLETSWMHWLRRPFLKSRGNRWEKIAHWVLLPSAACLLYRCCSHLFVTFCCLLSVVSCSPLSAQFQVVRTCLSKELLVVWVYSAAELIPFWTPHSGCLLLFSDRWLEQQRTASGTPQTSCTQTFR